MIVEQSRRGKRVVGVAVAAALIGTVALVPPVHAAPDEAAVFCDVPGQELAIAPISGLVEGQAVTWLSTTKGATPTEFTGEYVGKLDNALGSDAYGNPRDLLLVRLGGDTVAKTGVWAGSSGSPVYDANGALIGAVSYGFSWLPDDDVAGVTPAAYMKTIGDLPGVKKANAALQKEVNQLVDAPAGTPKSSGQIERIEPVRVTVGTTAKKLDKISKRLAKAVKGYKPVTPSGVAADSGALGGKDYPIIPGGNIAVSYAYGAVASASVGTVTAVCGDDVFAYGHPANWNSNLGASFHGASAAYIVPDLGGSYKLVSDIGRPKGTITDDRIAGVRGKLGAPAPSIAVTSVSRLGSHSSTAVSYVSADLLIPGIAGAQLGNDAVRMLDNQGEGTAKVSWSIDYRRENGKRGTLTNHNRYSSDLGFADIVGAEVAEDIAQIQMNPFEDVKILGVNITTRFTEGFRAARVTGVQVLNKGTWKKVKAGGTAKATRGKTYTFRAVLSPVPGAKRVTEYREFTVRVPLSAKKTVSVKVGVPQPFPGLPGGEPTEFPLKVPIDSFDALLVHLDDNLRNDVISRTRTYTSTAGKRYVKENAYVAPTVVVDEGKTISFKLEVPVKKATKKATPKKKSSAKG
ncbi:MAG: hypothetical protein IPJ61_00175 [Tessaracoccus sp.]|uniref:hypothetical protein n=1 Tax=Tessaracoccus sp. TaxID=1971211 RepID=UPI001ED4F350|nr:hypothetical protein [Tessaracoccus sp.]MBK7819514.1 hypothetical protein [Tessaracoccus sp.]